MIDTNILISAFVLHQARGVNSTPHSSASAVADSINIRIVLPTTYTPRGIAQSISARNEPSQLLVAPSVFESNGAMVF
jgi:hypothetical protein